MDLAAHVQAFLALWRSGINTPYAVLVAVYHAGIAAGLTAKQLAELIGPPINGLAEAGPGLTDEDYAAIAAACAEFAPEEAEPLAISMAAGPAGGLLDDTTKKAILEMLLKLLAEWLAKRSS